MKRMLTKDETLHCDEIFLLCVTGEVFFVLSGAEIVFFFSLNYYLILVIII